MVGGGGGDLGASRSSIAARRVTEGFGVVDNPHAGIDQGLHRPSTAARYVRPNRGVAEPADRSRDHWHRPRRAGWVGVLVGRVERSGWWNRAARDGKGIAAAE